MLSANKASRPALAEQKNILCLNSSTQSFVVGLEAAVCFQEQNDSSINFIGRQTWLNIWQVSEDKKTGKTKRDIPGKLCRLVRHVSEWEGREGGERERGHESTVTDHGVYGWLIYCPRLSPAHPNPLGLLPHAAPPRPPASGQDSILTLEALDPQG